MRVSSNSPASAVHSRQAQCSRGFTEPQVASPRLRMDSLPSGVSATSTPLASHHRPLCDCTQSLSSGLLFTHGGSGISGHGCDASVLGLDSGLCLSPLRSDPSCSRQGLAVQGVGAHSRGSVLDSTPLVSGPSGASGGDSLLLATKEESSQTTTFSSLPPEPPRAAADCLSYIKRSARHFGFSKGVASQTAVAALPD